MENFQFYFFSFFEQFCHLKLFYQVFSFLYVFVYVVTDVVFIILLLIYFYYDSSSSSFSSYVSVLFHILVLILLYYSYVILYYFFYGRILMQQFNVSIVNFKQRKQSHIMVSVLARQAVTTSTAKWTYPFVSITFYYLMVTIFHAIQTVFFVTNIFKLIL